MKKLIIGILVICVVVGIWFLFSEIYTAEAQKVDSLQFSIQQGESVSVLAERLADEQVIRHAWLFKKYLILKGADKKVNAGDFEVTKPITLARVVASLSQPGLSERSITIIPGWDLRDITDYLEEEGISSKEDFYIVVGEPANKNTSVADLDFSGLSTVLTGKPNHVSYEGYLAPDTYRIYNDATVEEIVSKLIFERDGQFDNQMYQDIKNSGRTIHEILTMASVLEREVRGSKDKAKVANIFWRRYDINWALQADSTVHYAVGKSGDVFTTAEDRDSLSPWNTYRYPGLPPSPICNPSLESIKAAIYPEDNDYWYFLTDSEGQVYYAKTLEEHNSNKINHL